MQIHCSAAHGDIEGVRRQLDRGVPIDARDPPCNALVALFAEGETPLMRAAESRHAGVEMVQFLVEKGADPNAVTWYSQETPLYPASNRGDLRKVRYLVEAGADPDFRRRDGSSAIVSAAYRAAHNPESLRVIEFLIGTGASVNVVSQYDGSALHAASDNGRFDIVRVLLDAGAKPQQLGWTPLMVAVASGTVDQVARELDRGGKLSAREHHFRRTPWLLSCQTGEVPKAQLLLRSGADMSDLALFGKTALMLACRQDNTGMVEWLLANGADPNEADDRGETALTTASRDGSLGCIRLLLDAGVDVHALDRFGGNALCTAANAEVARMLVDAGADLDYIDGEGYGLLKRAAEAGLEEVVRDLLAMGADPDASGVGVTALHIAARDDQVEVMRELIAGGADVNVQDPDLWTPLFRVQSIEATRILLDAGADPSHCDLIGHTPVSWARRSEKDPQLIELLERTASSK